MNALRDPTIAIAGLIGVFVWILAYIATDLFWIGAPGALGAAALVGQLRATRIARDAFRERDEALPILQSVVPKLRVGLPIDAAFLLACGSRATPTAGAIATDCARAQLGLDAAHLRRPAAEGSLNTALLTMIGAARLHGGDLALPFASLAGMIETDQSLRNKQSIASLHVRAQANALIGIAAIIVALALFGNQDSLLYLRDTLDGRRMIVVCLSLMIWGYVLIASLTSRIAAGEPLKTQGLVARLRRLLRWSPAPSGD